jgi:fructokinase
MSFSKGVCAMILCCGEALIDMLPRVTDRGEAAFAPYPGGAVFNTARALGRLGVATGFFCGLSSDMFGAQLADTLADCGVSTALCPRSDRPTTLAFVTLKDGQARYAFFDENTAMRMLAPHDLPVIGKDVTALFFGGISLVAEPCGASFEELALREAPARVIMLDPNIRPGFIRDERAYRARLARMIAVSDIVKISDEDLSWLMPGQSQDAAISALRAAGPHLVLVTRGAQGAEAHHAGGMLHVPAVPVTVVDTVGAGDTFNAGFLAALNAEGVLNRRALSSLPEAVIRAALTLANRAAAVVAGRAGANPPRMADLA